MTPVDSQLSLRGQSDKLAVDERERIFYRVTDSNGHTRILREKPKVWCCTCEGGCESPEGYSFCECTCSCDSHGGYRTKRLKPKKGSSAVTTKGDDEYSSKSSKGDDDEYKKGTKSDKYKEPKSSKSDDDEATSDNGTDDSESSSSISKGDDDGLVGDDDSESTSEENSDDDETDGDDSDIGKEPTKAPAGPSPTNEPKEPTKAPESGGNGPAPTNKPTKEPTKPPTKKPSEPTEAPTSGGNGPAPTSKPAKEPTKPPTKKPSEPTEAPTNGGNGPAPTTKPTKEPTKSPTKKPSEPTKPPTSGGNGPAPTSKPAKEPTSEGGSGKCQTVFTDDASLSDRDVARVADDFVPESDGFITKITFYGSYVVSGTSPVVGTPTPSDLFHVTYYKDDGNGLPGNVQGGPYIQFDDDTPLTLTVVGPEETEERVADSATMFKYEATHDQVAVTAGETYWMEIFNVSGDDSQWFWVHSLGGNLRAVVDGPPLNGYDEGDIEEGHDLAFCLNIPFSANSERDSSINSKRNGTNVLSVIV
jgi:hypothetical protein